MITIFLILFPLLAALLLVLIKGEQVVKIAMIAAIIEFTISIFALSQFHYNANVQFEANYAWIKSLGIHFHVGIDGISLLLVLLTTFLVPIIILASFNSNYKNPSVFYSLIFLMQMALIGVFVSLDGF